MRSERKRIIPILNALNPSSQLSRFIPYMLDDTLQVEKQFSGTQLCTDGYKMEDFAADNKRVMSWFSRLPQQFNEWRYQPHAKSNPILIPTGSRSFNASYTESDLECAIVSENFDDFLDSCRYLHAKYGKEHSFTALKTQAGLPLLVVKGETGFSCPDLSKLYPNKSLAQLEVTFRHPKVHDIIQGAGIGFFNKLTPEQLESYVFNKRHIELLLRNMPKDALFEGEPLKKALEAFKDSLSAKLKCLPAGTLQETPPFNKDVFASAIKSKTTLNDAIPSNIMFYQPPSHYTNKFIQPDIRPKFNGK